MLEEVLRLHGIRNVVAVDSRNTAADNNKVLPANGSNTSDTETETESVSSLTYDENKAEKQKKSVVTTASVTRQVNTVSNDTTTKDCPNVETIRRDTAIDSRKVETICENQEAGDSADDDDDDATVKTAITAATGFTRRSLIMPPPGYRQPEPEPYPQGAKAGGKWYRQLTEKKREERKLWTGFTCACSPQDVDPRDENFIYFDRLGCRKYLSPSGEQLENPLHTVGTKLEVVPNDGTILEYFKKMRLPLYHQKQHPGRIPVLRYNSEAQPKIVYDEWTPPSKTPVLYNI